jgi:hypothetical protein
MRPTVAGTFNISINPRPSDSVRFTDASSWEAICRDTAGSTAVAIDTPKRPIGRYISRKAYSSEATAPVPSPVASVVFTNRFTWVAASPIVPGPIKTRIRRSPGSRQSITGRYL